MRCQSSGGCCWSNLRSGSRKWTMSSIQRGYVRRHICRTGAAAVLLGPLVGGQPSAPCWAPETRRSPLSTGLICGVWPSDMWTPPDQNATKDDRRRRWGRHLWLAYLWGWGETWRVALGGERSWGEMTRLGMHGLEGASIKLLRTEFQVRPQGEDPSLSSNVGHRCL